MLKKPFTVKPPFGPQSWGLVPAVRNRADSIDWGHELPSALARYRQSGEQILCYGKGRSYGDVCLNDGGVLLKIGALDRILAFDSISGVIRAEPGVTIEELLQFALPRGWFVPVTPGTKFVTLGGAVANDVHGKNHHRAGTFGHAVLSFEVVRSDGTVLLCSPTQNSEYFAATIGGIGLTGVITWVEFQLKSVQSPDIDVESIQFGSLDEFFSISQAADQRFEYTVSWIDCVATGSQFGRGIFIGGNHAVGELPRTVKHRQLAVVPFDAPSWVLNRWSIKAFNTAFYHKQLRKTVMKRSHYDPFFYPLDAVAGWNRLYGKRGFIQFQCVVESRGALRAILAAIVQAGTASFLAVLKEFGDMNSPGMLSFPRRGYTLCLDFPFQGDSTTELLDRLEAMVREAKGALYPAKDMNMSVEAFHEFFPRVDEFRAYTDPLFSSSFWRRVNGKASDTGGEFGDRR